MAVNTEAIALLGLRGVSFVDLTDDALGLPGTWSPPAPPPGPACGLLPTSLKQRTRTRPDTCTAADHRYQAPCAV